MTHLDDIEKQQSDLRRRAEASLGESVQLPEAVSALSRSEVEKLVHELRVHQIELEMQNEELRQSQAELEALGARYFDLFDLAPVGYCTLSEKGLILEVNRTAARMLGVARSVLLKQPLTRFILSEDRGIHYRRHKQLFETQTPQVCELRMLSANAAPIWVQMDATVAKDADGVPMCRTIVSDITKRKQAEEELRQSAHYSRSLIEASLDPLVTISLEGKITDTNEATIKVTGVPRDKLIGSDFSRYFTDPEKATEGYRLILENGFVTDYPLTIRHQDGRLIEVLYNASVYRDTHGNVLGVLATARDVTESRNMEKQLFRADRLSSLGQLAGGIAHEIRNPLQGINFFIDVLSDEEKFTRTSKELGIFDEIKQNIKRMDGIIKRVRDLSRQQDESAFANLNPNEVIEESLKLWQSRMVKDNIQLKMLIEEDLPEVLGDSIEIEQVLANLIRNGIEAVAREGTLSIQARKGTLSFDVNRPAVIIVVQDSGPGIPLDQQGQIFNPFFTTKYTGTGLGLAISHRIISRHGGRISFESVQGGGTTFTVELPTAAVT